MKSRFELIFLGSGSAFCLNNFQSNLLLIDKKSNKKLLIDCGGDIRFSLNKFNLSAKDITDLYISHPHNDHIGGMEYLAFATKFLPGKGKINLFISGDLTGELWSKSLAGGLESLEGEVANLDSYFKVNSIEPNGGFVWQDINFQLVQVVHIMTGYRIVPSYGLLFKINQKTIFFTSDTQFCPNQIKAFYEKADIIFHDCETSQFASGVHAHYQDLKKLPDKYQQKMWLYHYQEPIKEEKVLFLGWVKQGQKFKFL